MAKIKKPKIQKPDIRASSRSSRLKRFRHSTGKFVDLSHPVDRKVEPTKCFSRPQVLPRHPRCPSQTQGRNFQFLGAKSFPRTETGLKSSVPHYLASLEYSFNPSGIIRVHAHPFDPRSCWCLMQTHYSIESNYSALQPTKY